MRTVLDLLHYKDILLTSELKNMCGCELNVLVWSAKVIRVDEPLSLLLYQSLHAMSVFLCVCVCVQLMGELANREVDNEMTSGEATQLLHETGRLHEEMALLRAEVVFKSQMVELMDEQLR